MVAFDWYFYKKKDTGRTKLIRIEPSSADSVAADYRFVRGDKLADLTSQPNLVFRAVGGKMTCASQALHTPREFPLPQLKDFLRATSRPANSRLKLRPNANWSAFKRRVATIDPNDTIAIREVTLEILRARPDYRIGLASLVAGHEGLGMDALIVDITERENSAERIVGELLEIACLNILYKSPAEDSLINAARSLLSLVADPLEIRRTWSAHLLRTLEFNGTRWQVQVNAIDLAESILGDIWAHSADSFTKEKLILEGNLP